MVNKPKSKQTKENREKAVIAIRVIVIAILVAGIHVYGLPTITLEEGIGTLSAVTLFGVVLRWVK